MKTKLTMILICCVACSITANSQTINLQLQSDYALGAGNLTPRFAVGDLNNDGKPDVVTATGQTATLVSILLNNGAGGLSAPTTFGASLNASVAAIGDFNNDGNADLAVGTINNAGLNIRLGNGSGSFPNETNTVVVDSVTDLVTADFNGDGNLDLAVTKNGGYSTQPTNAVRVLLGNGAGGFAAPTGFAVGSAPLDIEVTDFNADGRPDIAVVAFTVTNTVSILLNNGAGGFTAAPTFSWANATSGAKIVAADFNRDCATDLAVVRSDSVAILQGNNTGNFTLSPITLSNSPTSLAVGDFNLDRKTDLAIGRFSAAGGFGFIILPGDGAGSFGTAFSLNSSLIPDNLAVLDVNTDGKMDIAMSRRTNSFSIYRGNSAMFTRTEMDFDGDLRADLSVFRPSNGTWFVNRSIGSFAAQQWGLGSDKLTPADYDGDGKTDIAVYRQGAPSVAAFYILNSSNNTIRAEQFGQNGDDSSIVGDFDGDGKADPAVYRDSAIGSQSYFFYRGSLNNPNGTVTYLPWGTAGDKPVRGDFDGDGRADAAVFRPSNGVWYIRQSSNNQGRVQPFGLSTDRRVPADYDGDGRTDIAVVRPANNDWYILNSGNGTVSHRQWGASSDALTPGDYNGDGRTEVSTYRPSDGNWYVPQCGVNNQTIQKFGASGDVAVPSAFVP